MFVSVIHAVRVSLAFVVASFAGIGLAGTPTNYYNGADTSNASTLRASLNNIVSSGPVQVGYGNTFPALYVTDEDPAAPSNVLMVYGRDSRPKTDSSGSSDGTPFGAWNREHIFPQSFFNSAEPMRSDLHALMPADWDTNTHRSNYPYQVITSGATYNDVFGNKKTGGATASWEPADVDKGRVARAVFFMDVRYEGQGSLPNLTIINSYPGGTGAGQMAYLNTLLDWHRQYPPTAWERGRNAKVYNRQKNANPFVDHPEWAGIVYGGTAWTMTNGDTLDVDSTPLTAGTITAGTTDIPMLSVDLDLIANEFHIGQVGVTKLGSLLDGEITNIKLWWDVDRDGVATSVDTLLDTRTFAAGAATFAPSPAFYVAPGIGDYGTRLLVTASIPSSASNGGSFGVRMGANSIVHNVSGGTDTNPVFANQDSNLVTIGSAISGGDTISVAITDRAPDGAVSGSADIPMASVNLTLGANEWDLSQMDVAKLGTLADSSVAALNLYIDANSNGVVDPGEQLVATTTFSGGLATFSLSPSNRITPGTRSYLITASFTFDAAQDATIGVRVLGSGIRSSLTGGADVDPTFGDFDSSLTTITVSSGGGTNLIISEIFEGTSGNLKYVELHNLGSTSINLSDYRLRRYTNGSLSVTNIALSGAIAAGGFHVIANNATDFDNAFGSVPGAVRNATNTNINHNGNDLYDLQQISTLTVVDSFGADLAGSSTDFAKDVVAFRIGDQLPNSGGWGTPVNTNQGTGTSPSGYWSTILVTSGNGNAADIGTPGFAGGSGGTEVPVTMSAFEME